MPVNIFGASLLMTSLEHISPAGGFALYFLTTFSLVVGACVIGSFLLSRAVRFWLT